MSKTAFLPSLFLLFISVAPLAANVRQAPPRLYVLDFSKKLSNQKPVAQADMAGWLGVENFLIGSPEKGSVGAYNEKTKAWEWWLDTPVELSAPISLEGDFIFLSFRSGLVRKVNWRDGKVVWEFSLANYSDHPPVISGDKVYFWTVTQVLYALDKSKGNVVWVREGGGTGPQVILEGRASPFLFKGRLWLGLAQGDLVWIDPQTGTKLGELNTGSSITGRFRDVVSDMQFIGDRFFLAHSEGTLTCIQVSENLVTPPEICWTKEFASVSTLGKSGEDLLIGDVFGSVQRIASKDGSVVWQTPLFGTIQSLAPQGAHIYWVTSEGLVGNLDFNTGSILWLDTLHATVLAPLKIDTQRLMITTGQKNVYFYKP